MSDSSGNGWIMAITFCLKNFKSVSRRKGLQWKIIDISLFCFWHAGLKTHVYYYASGNHDTKRLKNCECPGHGPLCDKTTNRLSTKIESNTKLTQ